MRGNHTDRIKKAYCTESCRSPRQPMKKRNKI
uniref:Uncharacterized protein n=1 Tax=Anguilla anguilla TaxID=7936 RepID=A0A0E9U5L6_ANGAN